ncbi:hypothetical protein [Aurantivibrio infirmus]
MEYLFAVTLILLVLSGVAIIIYRLKIEKYLQAAHPDTWRSLGKPNIGSAEDKIEVNNTFINYFLSKEYLSLKDPKLNNLALVAGIVSKFGVMLTLLMVFLGISVWVFPNAFS